MDRGRDRDRDRHAEPYRSRHERSRSRERRRERSRSRSRERRRDRQRSRERSSSSSESRRHDRRAERPAEPPGGTDYPPPPDYVPPPPTDDDDAGGTMASNSLLLRGLSPHSTETTIPDFIKAYCACDAVRLVRDRLTGEPRGLAFVDVPTAADAQTLVNVTHGRMLIDGVMVSVELSRSPRVGGSAGSDGAKDWLCAKCQTNNFARRRLCFACGAERLPSDEAPPSDDAQGSGVPPGPVLIVKGLDAATTEPAIRAALDAWAAYGVSALSVRLIRDKLSGASRGFAFAEFATAEHAAYVLQQARAGAIYIDGRPARLDYSMSPQPAAAARPLQGRAAAAMDHVAWQLEQRQYQDATYQYGRALPTDALGGDAVEASVQQLLARINGREGTFVYNGEGGYYYESSSGLYYYPQPLNYYFDAVSRAYFVFSEPSGDYVVSYEPPAAQPAAAAPPPGPPAEPPAAGLRCCTACGPRPAPSVAAPPSPPCPRRHPLAVCCARPSTRPHPTRHAHISKQLHVHTHKRPPPK
eukprot:TRINITY_DN1670_c0_g1_i1.p1 TRINITY_DN1670_c0_g1~~TRINITY_DN1670_c0_g1_i1.p1  ORF type:complete len:527 (+),score=161.90 TRINITY_DN1670_c0_g1_i1:162-1742(+)